jgi:hypothetical protein
MTNAKKMAALLKTDATTNAPPNANSAPKVTERQGRAVAALLRGAVMREGVDKIAGCSNGPALIKELRGLGLVLPCERVRATDRDGKPCRPGRYSLTDEDRETLRGWGFA